MQKVSEAFKTISSVLDKCILIEKYTESKYKELSIKTDNIRARILFEELSAAGKAHARMLGGIKSILTETGEISILVAVSAALEIPKPNHSSYESEVKHTYYSMRQHLNLERDFKEIYEQLSKKIKKF